MPVVAEDYKSVAKVDEAMGDLRKEAASVMEKNGGTIVGLYGDDATKAKELMDGLNVLGERRDELAEQEKGQKAFEKVGDLLDEEDEHPGHPTKGKKGEKTTKLDDDQPQDVGALFLASDAWKQFAEKGTKDVAVKVPTSSVFGRQFKGIGEIPSDYDRRSALLKTLFDSTGFPSRPDIFTEPIDVLFQAANIGPLMPQGSTDSDVIRYPVETVTASGAIEVAEGVGKPEAQLSFTDVDEPLQTIAVLLPVTNKALRNQPFLRSYLNSRLALFVQNREDAQLLNGNGTTPNLKGILARSGINTATTYSIGGANPDQALIDAVFKASMRVRDAYLEPDSAVMKPSVWEIARLAKDGNRNYLLGPPADDAPQRLWGLKAVLNANMPAQSAGNKDVLVGAFRTAAMIVRRGGMELAISDSHGTTFGENKLTLRAEEEVGLCVFRPAGFAVVTSNA